MLASAAFPGGYTAVGWEFRGFRQGHSSSGRWREGGAARTSIREERRGKERDGGRKREKTDLLVRVLYLKCLADVLSDSEVRGDDCIDGFYSQVISEKEKESRLKQKECVVEKHRKSAHTVYSLNEN